MAYQPYQIDPRSFLPDPAGAVEAGMSMFERVKRARLAEQEANERRAQTLRENQRSDAYLKLQQDQTAEGREAARAKLLGSDDFRAMLATNPQLAIEQARRMGINLSREDIMGEAPMQPRPAPPSAPSMPMGPERPGQVTEDDLFPENPEREIMAPRGPGAPEMDRQAMLASQGLAPPPLGQEPPQPQAPPMDLNAQRAEKVKRGYRIKTEGGASLYDSVEQQAAREAAQAKRTEAFRAIGGDEKWGQMAAVLAQVPGLSEETIAKAVMTAKASEQEGIAKGAEKAGDREFTLKRDEIQNAEAMKRARVAAASKPPQPTGHIYGGEGGEIIGTTPDPKNADAVNKANASFVSLDKTLAALERSYEGGRFVNPLGAEAARRKALGSAATIEYKNMAELGALSGPDMALVEDAISGGYTQEQALAKLRTARSTLAEKQSSFMSTRGLRGSEIVPRLRGESPASGPGDQGATRAKKLKAATNPEDRAAVKWARENPTDPRAEQILKANGM